MALGSPHTLSAVRGGVLSSSARRPFAVTQAITPKPRDRIHGHTLDFFSLLPFMGTILPAFKSPARHQIRRRGPIVPSAGVDQRQKQTALPVETRQSRRSSGHLSPAAAYLSGTAT